GCRPSAMAKKFRCVGNTRKTAGQRTAAQDLLPRRPSQLPDHQYNPSGQKGLCHLGAGLFFHCDYAGSSYIASQHSESVNIILDNSLKHRALQGIEMLPDRLEGKQYIGAAFRGRPENSSARDLRSESFATLII